MRNKHSRKGKSRLRLLMAAATFSRFAWYLNNARICSTTTGHESALLGTGTCGSEALHTVLGGVFRQAYNVSAAHFQVEAWIFQARQAGGARRCPADPDAPPNGSRPGRVVLFSHIPVGPWKPQVTLFPLS